MTKSSATELMHPGISGTLQVKHGPFDDPNAEARKSEQQALRRAEQEAMGKTSSTPQNSTPRAPLRPATVPTSNANSSTITLD
ncbi:unnamed protein product, partial [Mesorhabditis spiculigera]